MGRVELGVGRASGVEVEATGRGVVLVVEWLVWVG